MEWTELHELNLCKDVLVVEHWKHPYRSKERRDLWNEIATNLNASDHPKFKVSKRSVIDRLTSLQQKYKAKMRMEKAASGIDCEETYLDKALEEIMEKEKAATDARRLQDDNKNAEKQQRRSTASEPLSVWVKPRKGMLRNKTNKPRRQRKEEGRHRK